MAKFTPSTKDTSKLAHVPDQPPNLQAIHTTTKSPLQKPRQYTQQLSYTRQLSQTTATLDVTQPVHTLRHCLFAHHGQHGRTAHTYHNPGTLEPRINLTPAVNIEPAEVMAPYKPHLMERQRTTTLHSDITECRINALLPPLLIAPSPPTFNGNWSTYNGTIVNIHDSTCPIFRTFRYDLEWKCCIGTLENTSFIGQLSDDARVILWNNGNTWINKKPRFRTTA